MELREEREEREIRVFDLFISLCQRWRSLLICLVIGAVVLGAYGWYKSGSGTAGAPSSPVEITDEDWSAVLGPDAMNDVQQLYSSIQEYDKLMQEQSHVTDLSEKLENMEHITAIQNNVSATKARFTDDQKAYLAFLMGDTNIIPGNEDTYDHKANEQSAQEAAGGRHISKKYVVVGALLGLILAAIVIIIKYIATATIKTAGETEENLDLQILGRFDGSNKFYDKRKTALDRWLRRVKQKNKQKLSYEERVKMVSAKMQIAADKYDLKKICIAADSNVELEKVQNKEFLDDIIAKLGGTPEAVVLNNILGRSDALHDMAGADAVVLVLQTENSRFTDAQYERILCEGYGVPVLGAIVVE